MFANIRVHSTDKKEAIPLNMYGFACIRICSLCCAICSYVLCVMGSSVDMFGQGWWYALCAKTWTFISVSYMYVYVCVCLLVCLCICIGVCAWEWSVCAAIAYDCAKHAVVNLSYIWAKIYMVVVVFDAFVCFCLCRIASLHHILDVIENSLCVDVCSC